MRPILTNAPLSAAIVRDLDDRLKAEPCTHAKKLSVYETAVLDSAGSFSGKYVTYNLMTCTITRPTNVLQFISKLEGAERFQISNLAAPLPIAKDNR